MIDDFYGYKPQSLKYETALKRINDKKKLSVQKQERKKRTTVTQMFQESDEVSKLNQLEKFIKTYNYYIHNLLWSKADPFLRKKRE